MLAFAPIGYAPPGGPFNTSVLIAEPPADAPEPITLERAKRHLRVVVDDEDEDILMMISAARQMLERRLQRALVPRQVTESAYGFSPGMPLSVVPYLGDLTVEYVDPDGATQALAPGSYELDITEEPVRIHPLDPWPVTRYARGAVKLHYQAGYAPGAVPAPLCQWMLLAIGTMYGHRESVVAGVSMAELPENFMKWLYQPYMVYK